MLQIFHNPRYDFIGKRRYGYVFSAIILIASLVVIGRHWARTGDFLNYGIDFRGGTMMQVRFAERPEVGQLRDNLREAGFSNASIQAYGDAKENSILIRVSEQLEAERDLVSRIRRALRPPAERTQEDQGLVDLNTVGEADLSQLLQKELAGEGTGSLDPAYLRVARAIVAARGAQPDGRFTSVDQVQAVEGVTPEMVQAVQKHGFTGSLAFLKTESVGPAVGRDLRTKALYASIIANLLILGYLWFRFELRYGVAAVLCLVHDVIFVVGVFAFTEREFDLTVLAAILTVIGYSVNDTVVIFDRVRSNLRLMKKEPLENILNASINQTLSRSVLTSGLTLLVVIALFLYGGEVLSGFSFALLIGIIEGSYSTIFVASPLVLVWQKYIARGK